MTNEKKVTFLQDINENSIDYAIKVNILHLWKCFFHKNSTNASSLDMILVDKQGTKIYSSIPYNLIKDFEHLLEEGGFRLISNFEVKPNKSSFVLAKHPCKLNFLKETSVSDATAFESVGELFEFCSFELINKGNVDANASFDIIGQVIENKPLRVMGTGNLTRHILECQLRDDKGTIVSCALWDNYAKQFLEYVSTNKNSDDPVIILLQLARFNIWKKKPQVSNCMYGAKLYINENMRPILEFKESLKGKRFGMDSSKQYPKLLSKVILIKPQDSYLKFPLKGIVELLRITEPTTCVVVGKITSIITDQGWNYLACCKCNKKGDTHHIYPNEFNSILDKRYVLKVEISKFNVKNKYKIFTVFNLSNDADVINSVLDQPGTKENAINLDDESDQDEVGNLKDPKIEESPNALTKKRENDDQENEDAKYKIPKIEKD
uniref:uncharacterized protein LOC122591407 n=1 Tax=Erigeron canadensis TaxID=72917 RepID=UPI001CB9CED6|nr:uncharacterized protein LOC122591407 [Erigeron canadensis]